MAKLLDGAGHHPPDLNRLSLFGRDIGKGAVCCFEFDLSRSLKQMLYSEFTVHDSNNNILVSGFERFVHYENVIVKDARLNHGTASGPQQVSGLRVGDELFDQIYVALTLVLSWRWKPGLNIAQ